MKHLVILILMVGCFQDAIGQEKVRIQYMTEVTLNENTFFMTQSESIDPDMCTVSVYTEDMIQTEVFHRFTGENDQIFEHGGEVAIVTCSTDRRAYYSIVKI